MYTLHKISRGIIISTFELNNLTWYVQKNHTKGRSISFSGNLFIPRFLHRRVYGSLKWSCNFVSSFSFVLSCFATEPWFSERCLKMQICYLFYKEIVLIANKIKKIHKHKTFRRRRQYIYISCQMSPILLWQQFCAIILAFNSNL